MSDDDLIADMLRNYEPIPDHLLRDWTMRLRDGETGNKAHGIAKSMIEDFCLAVSLGKQPPQITIEWIAHVLGEILDNGKPAAREAFSLLPRRVGGHSQIEKHIQIMKWVYIAIARGYEESQAINEAAAIYGHDERTIKDAWRSNNKGEGWNIHDDDVTAEIFKQENRPLPKPRSGRKTKK